MRLSVTDEKQNCLEKGLGYELQQGKYKVQFKFVALNENQHSKLGKTLTKLTLTLFDRIQRAAESHIH